MNYIDVIKDIKQEILPDPYPEAIYREYQARLGNEISAYKAYNIKQLNYMWLRDRLWFVKQLIADHGREKAERKLEELIDQKALEIGSRYKRWAQGVGITNAILALRHGILYDWPWISPSWWFRYYPDDRNPTHLVLRLVCHIGDFWNEQQREYREFGRIFCDVDKKITQHIDPRLTLDVVNYIYSVDSDETCPYCKFVWTINSNK